MPPKVTIDNIADFVDGIRVNRPPRIHGNNFQVTAPTATAGILIAGANPARSSMVLINVTGTFDVWIGYGQVPTASNGILLLATKGSNFTLYSQDAIWAFAPGGAQVVSVAEESYGEP